MKWREGDRGREGAEIISTKVIMQSDSSRFPRSNSFMQTKNFHPFTVFATFEQINILEVKIQAHCQDFIFIWKYLLQGVDSNSSFAFSI